MMMDMDTTPPLLYQRRHEKKGTKNGRREEADRNPLYIAADDDDGLGLDTSR